MAEAQQEHDEPLTPFVFGMTKIFVIARKSVKLFARHYTRRNGMISEVTTARALSESESIASAIRKVLVERKVHRGELEFCRAELLVDNYFHAIFEATKSVAEKLRQKSGLGSDGATSR